MCTIVAAAVITSGGRVLLIRRAVAEGALSWQFPAGKTGPGESAQDTAVREAAEEAGVTVIARRMIGERVHPAPERTSPMLPAASPPGLPGQPLHGKLPRCAG
jgi:8-oxo-dGTP diphosphatase